MPAGGDPGGTLEQLCPRVAPVEAAGHEHVAPPKGILQSIQHAPCVEGPAHAALLIPNEVAPCAPDDLDWGLTHVRPTSALDGPQELPGIQDRPAGFVGIQLQVGQNAGEPTSQRGIAARQALQRAGCGTMGERLHGDDRRLNPYRRDAGEGG